ncbi:hypothetical protein POM88_040886 [Heracleum sosnowskyi]|uniref:F-box domain-containing protein n=1 Tax=Heracleum sosnowskyi TaxID=360622 RepID=A0AAD8M7S9_9APIA|nr:hypothetical protein POM88_040886 [Heracleum sosnowskyi]
MTLVGHKYTWERGRGTTDWTEVRLDRALTTSLWLNLFPLAKLYNLEGSTSDHSPLLLVPQQKPLFNTQRRFRFENAWLTKPMCEQLTKDVWESTEGWSIQAKIEKCGDTLTGDLISEILLLLSVKSLLRFKLVSKPWRSLISSNLNCIMPSLNSHCLQITRPLTFSVSSTLLSNWSTPRVPYSRGAFSFTPYTKLIGSHDGVVCVWVSNFPRQDIMWFLNFGRFLVLYKSNNSDIYIWNHATTVQSPTPTPA